MLRPNIEIGLYSGEESEWVSCKRIANNLKDSHQLANKKIKFLNFGRGQNELLLLSLAEEILRLSPKKIIFLDHQPHPANLLAIILPRLNPETILVFHSYGDFLLPFPENWPALEFDLKKFPIMFLNASQRQKSYFQQFLNQAGINHLCPFPVNVKDFALDIVKRKEFREKLKLKQDEFVWLYSGRLSSQKNIIKLIDVFSKYKKQTKKSDKLFFVGAFDNVGIPFLNIYQEEHEYYYHYNQAISALDEDVKKDIAHLGVYFGKELNGILNLADAFVSLSSHNDEDYGMAVAEALCTGLPCLLSDWGGYSSFKKYSSKGRVELLSLKLENGLFNFDDKEVLTKMKKIRKLKHSRKVYGQESQRVLSIEAVAKKLKVISKYKTNKFKGFSSKLKTLTTRWRSGRAFHDSKNRFNSYYRSLYATYFN